MDTSSPRRAVAAESSERPETPDWAALDTAAVLARLNTDPATGLSPAEVETRRARYGRNALPEPRRRTALMRFLAQFNNVLIYVLLVAAAVTLLLQHWIDAGVILAVVVGNAIIGFIQEGKAEQALDAIRTMLAPSCTVVRDGERLTMPAEDLVPGDIVHLEGGDRVPADLRIVGGREPRMQEAVLTGESVATAKAPAPVAPGASLGDRTSMAFSGTYVTAGTARGVVVATGAATEIGRISDLVSGVRTLTSPLLRTIDRFGVRLTIAILAIAVAMFLFGWLVRDYAFVDIFMAVVGMAVAAIPEGLPAVLTITLALGAQVMARRNAIARRLPAIETLGSVSVICTDKTGTLTKNEMMVAHVATADHDIAVTGAGYDHAGTFYVDGVESHAKTLPILEALARAGVLASDAGVHPDGDGWRVHGDPMEGALVVLARKAGIDVAALRRAEPRVDGIPFTSERRYMASLHDHHDGDSEVLVKGAPDRLLDLCHAERTATGDRPLDRDRWTARIEAIAAEGQRVLAVALRRLDGHRTHLTEADAERDLVLLGLVGLQDPPRPEAVAAIAECQRAGIRVKMITGDHAVTARAIARELGLVAVDRALTGAELDAMSPDALRRAVADVDVFARTSPENKLRLVEALQADGAVIAMTGDGVNDSPALKRADIGVAMGCKGSEAAKEASDLVLADDNFATIAAAVREGRRVYDNLIKTIQFMLPTNGGEALVLIASVLMGFSMPITPVQILWVNLVTAVTLALTLAFEPGEQTIMARPPRPMKEPILPGRLVWRIAFVSVLFLIGVLAIYRIARGLGATIPEARTLATNTLVVFEIAYLFNVRRFGRAGPGRGVPPITLPVGAAVATVLGLQVAFTYLPGLDLLFDTQPLSAAAWGATALAGVAVFGIVEVEKRIETRILGPRRRPGETAASGPPDPSR
ncbi:HAD-IC family P-type ATPase [Roseospira goensis]|uniref:Magnesium-transporting ATPase (P-type) n=1 Tax=Roseospira goensis TaxID=391922 RepID=A0A7W6S0E9_9PROT|nr:HAD-IC family P-type ATPase [Roseospira goensis]MBB4285984.1 magnesium-transporting ATPase (P-type) [Roseospira goensis]